MDKKLFKKLITSVSAFAVNVGGISFAHVTEVSDKKVDKIDQEVMVKDQTESKSCCGENCNCNEVLKSSQNEALKSAQDEFINNPEKYLKGAIDSAMSGWDFVRESFRRARIDSNANLEKLGLRHLDKSNDWAEYYLRYINDFLKNNDDIKGIKIDGVTIRRNDAKSEDIRRNLTIFNLARKFELIDHAISGFADENTYKNNPELIKKVIESSKVFLGDEKYLPEFARNWNDDVYVKLWRCAMFGYLNGIFNFYDNFTNIEKLSMDDCKGILKLEFDYADKATSLFKDFEPLNTAIKFMYNYTKDVLDGKLPDLSKDIPNVTR